MTDEVAGAGTLVKTLQQLQSVRRCPVKALQRLAQDTIRRYDLAFSVVSSEGRILRESYWLAAPHSGKCEAAAAWDGAGDV